jgi:two-component system, cell cycle response regulator DivK
MKTMQIASNLAARARILVVDDNSLNRKLMRLVLPEHGYDTRFASSAEEVAPLLSDWRPELILLDLQLSGMDGLELARRLKADPATSGIRIVILTACAMPEEKEAAVAVGCDGYLTKPIDTRTLPDLLAQCLSSQQGA